MSAAAAIVMGQYRRGRTRERLVRQGIASMAFTLHPRGAFSLAAAADFAEGFPGIRAGRAGEELHIAWAVDGDWRTVVARLRQDGDAVRGELGGSPPADLARAARRDVERILCLDADGSGFATLGERDPVV